MWRSIGAEKLTKLTVEATEIDTALAGWPARRIRYAWAGGTTVSGAHHLGLVLGVVPKAEHERYASPEEFIHANPLPLSGQQRQMTLDTWLGSTSAAIQTDKLGLVKISRQSVLTYVANRKGGVHFDPRRDLAAVKLSKRRREVESYLLDHGLLRVGHLSGPEFEVQSMTRTVAASEWADEIVRVAYSAAPADFHGDPNELKFWTGLQEADGTGWATSRFEPDAEQASGAAAKDAS
jgi:hypothetical protein